MKPDEDDENFTLHQLGVLAQKQVSRCLGLTWGTFLEGILGTSKVVIQGPMEISGSQLMQSFVSLVSFGF